jgi:hypothetical protein
MLRRAASLVVPVLLFCHAAPAVAQEGERKWLNREEGIAASQPAASQPVAAPPASAPALAPTESAPPPEAAPTLVPAEARTHEAQLAMERERGPVDEDLDTNVELFRRGGFTLQMGGMVQVAGAFYVGNDAAIALGDPADAEGFRVRRARFGFGGNLFHDWGYYLAVDLKDAVVAAQGGDQGNEILDAKVGWYRFPFARVVAGVGKVAYSVFSLQSSSKLALIERPLMVDQIGPDRRVGLSVEGDVWNLQYAVGCYNGSDGVTSGNRLAGLAGTVYVQYHILGKPQDFVPRKLRIGVGGGYVYEDGTAVNTHRASGNITAEAFRTRLQGEYLFMQTDPDAEPAGGPVEAGSARRWGAAGELSFFVWRELLQLAVRYEYYDDAEGAESLGAVQLIGAGLNLYLYRHNLKLQVNYVNRDEREGQKEDNDIGFAQLQAMF